MKIKLYKPFEHWYHGGTIWLISDTHFDDPDCKLMHSDWPTPSKQIELINNCVGRNDTIIHLGDVGDENWIRQIKGYKVLLLGNHDKGKSNYEKLYSSILDGNLLYSSSVRKDVEDFNEHYFWDYNRKPYLDNNGLFDEVYEGPLFINDKICLSHEPIELGFGINIHGHSHGMHGSGSTGCSSSEGWARCNIVCDLKQFMPVRLDKLISGLKTKDLHRVTIDKAKKDPLHKEK